VRGTSHFLLSHFFFSWSSDQDYLANKSYSEYQAINGSMENALGLLGAWLGYIFVHNGFGIAAFLLLPMLSLLGLWLFFDYKPFLIIRVAIHSLLLMALLSLGLAFIFKSWYPLIGGAFGYFGIVKLTGLIGTAGTVLFLLAYVVLYSILFLNLNPFDKINMPSLANLKNKIKSAVNKDIKDFDDSEDSKKSTEIELDNQEGIEGIKDLKTPTPLPPIEVKTIKPNDEPVSQEINLDTKSPTPKAKTEDDGEFVIEDKTKVEEELVKTNNPERKDHYGVDTEFDPKLELSNYIFPTLDLLKEYDQKKQEIDVEEIEKSKI